MPAAGFGAVHDGCADGWPDADGFGSVDGVGGFGFGELAGPGAPGVSVGGVHEPPRHVQPAPGCTPRQLPPPAPAGSAGTADELDPPPAGEVVGTITHAPF